MTFQYICFIIFACLGYLIITDKSIAQAFLLVLGILRTQYEKTKWWIWNNPKTPWASYIIHRRSMKLAEELMKEIQDGSK